MGRHHENVNRVPGGEPNLNDNDRKVYIGYRAVGGPVAGWITNVTSSIFGSAFPKYMPNPTYHWCVVVGDWLHQLQATSLNGGWNWYDNDKFSHKDAWKTFEVGTTRFNDVAIKSAGIQTIENMPEQYNVVNNNCQTFTLRLCDLICRGGRRKVFTSWSFTQLQAGFIPGQEEGEIDKGKEIEVAIVENGAEHFEFLEKIEGIMAENTPEISREELAETKVENPKVEPTVA